ncbi:MAG: hypothetical protein H6741_01175 [Alphaproteobacteria bacterium]|nr:hypothetical protein [Alphaproteobacteria bacterium]
MAFNIQQRDREVFLEAFSSGASWSARARDPELMRGWRVLQERRGRVILAHHSGAVGVLELDGDTIKKAALKEEGEARALLGRHGFRPTDEIEDRAKRILRPGRELDQALDECFPRRLGVSELKPQEGELRRFRIGAHGVLEFRVGPEGALRSTRWRTGEDAIRLIEADQELRAWDVPDWPQAELPARTPAEAALYVAVRKGEIQATRHRGGLLEIKARTPEGARLFSFKLGRDQARGPHDFGEGRSAILDPLELVLFAARVEEELPAAPTPERIAFHAARHRLAAAGLREATHFIPEGATAPPPEAFSSALGRGQLEAHPERFRRDALLLKAEELDAMARLLAEDVTEPETLQARDGREARWWLRAQGAPVDLIVEDPGGGWSVHGPGEAARRYRLALDPEGPPALTPSGLITLARRIRGALPAPGAPLCPGLLDHKVSELQEALACLQAAGSAADGEEVEACAQALQAAQAAANTAPRERVPAPPPLTPISGRRLLRELAEGRPVLQGLQAAAERVPIRVQPMAQLQLPDGRRHQFYVVSELSDGEPRIGVLSVLVGADEGVLGRRVLVGADAARQRDLLAEALGGLQVDQAEAQARQSVAALEAQLRPLLLAAGQGDAEARAALMPRPGDAEKAFSPELAPEIDAKLTAWFDSEEPPRIRAKEHQSEVRVSAAPVGALAGGHPMAKDFAGAWRSLAEQGVLAPNRTWVTWVYTAPGETRGMRYDGLVWLDDHWAWFPKPWRALK